MVVNSAATLTVRSFDCCDHAIIALITRTSSREFQHFRYTWNLWGIPVATSSFEIIIETAAEKTFKLLELLSIHHSIQHIFCLLVILAVYLEQELC